MGYPVWFYPALLGLMTLLLVSGGLLTPTYFDLRLAWDVPWRLEGDAHIAVAALHAGLSFLMFMLLGSLWSIHMRAGWRHRQHVGSGLGLVALMNVLLLSAIGIYYLGDETAALYSATLHLGAGTLLALLFVFHAVIGYRRAVVHRSHRHS